jgi:UDP-3-O-[3-hydroxymyristoyl] glucosamine N-acyltransferase
MPFTAAEIARHLQGAVLGDASVVLKNFAPADRARSGDVTFAENADYFARADQSQATAIIVDGEFTSARKVLIRVPNARIAFAKTLELFFPEPTFPAGVHPTAIVDRTAQVDHIGAGCVLGEDVVLFPSVVLYARSELGNRVRIHSGAVIGSDGFGYVQDHGVHRKVPQIGNVVVQEDVEIGANVTVDRGALGPTVIGKGTKIDNLVQLGHNVVIGEHGLLVAQVGIAGSTKLGDYVTLGGQVGLAGHIQLGNRVSVAAQSGVMHNIPDGEKWLGYPAQPDRQTKRQMIAVQHLPELIRRVAELEKKLRSLDRAE